jgi:hypothetical protein
MGASTLTSILHPEAGAGAEEKAKGVSETPNEMSMVREAANSMVCKRGKDSEEAAREGAAGSC